MVSIYRRLLPGAIVATAIFFSGCVAVGPETINRDRFDYGKAIGDSWKRQTLMNLVRLRYSDTPVFMEVSSVINQYNLEGEVEVGGSFVSGGSDVQAIGATGTYYDRPTISYTPLHGEAFTRSILRPLPPAAVVYLIQAGWPAEFVVPLAVRAINGIFGQTRMYAMSRPADPRFNQLIAAMKQIQQATGVSLRVEKREGNSALIELILRKDSDKLDSGTLTLRQILGLDLDATVFNLTFGLLPRNDKEVAMLTRSLLDIMAELATGVEVPASHETAGWVTPLIPHSETLQPLLAVRSGEQKPEHAFAAIPYQDHWYWIDNSDIQSKRTLVALMFFFSLTNSGDASLAPVVTINAGS